MNVGVIGVGYWGKNIVRNLVNCKKVKEIIIFDINDEKKDEIKRNYPFVKLTKSIDEIIRTNTDIIFVVTPPETHFELGRKVLENNKHLYIEKPFVISSKEADFLIKEAEKKNLKIMSGHTFLYSPPVRKIKDLIESGEIGKIEFISFRRINLGIHRQDVNVLWDLLPHDLSMIFYWLGDDVEILESKTLVKTTVGEHPDVGFVMLKFSDNVIAEGIVSWLSPRKIRETIIVGSKKMILYNDTEAEEKIKIYDKKVEELEPSDFGEYQLAYRVGDITIPSLDTYEPLAFMVRDFISAVEENKSPLSDGKLGLKIVESIEKILKS